MSETVYTSEIADKLKIIEESKNYDELKRSGILSEPDLDEAYYFVSYSHRDYKRVLRDIFRLKEQGIHIWYDRGLETGKSWRDEALKKMTSYHCKGVIIYMSEQFISSAACRLELKTAVRANKSAVITDMGGACAAIAFDNKKLQAKWEQYQKDAAVFTGEPDYAIFAQQIRQLKSPELFSYQYFDYGAFVKKTVRESSKKVRTLLGLSLLKLFLGPVRKKVALISAIHDRDVESVTLPDHVYNGKKRIRVVGVDAGAMNNCVNLQYVTMPDGWMYLARGAFYNCTSLKEVRLGTPVKLFPFVRFGELQMPFEHCTALENIVTPKKGRVIFNGTFYGCKQLTSWACPKNVSLNGSTFSGCSALEKAVLSKRSYVGSTYQFYNCRSLSDVEIHPAARSRVICSSAFYNCGSLKKITLHKNVREIGESAFESCALREIELPKRTNTVHASAFKNCRELAAIRLRCRQLKCIAAGDAEPALDEVFPYAETVVARKSLKIKFKNAFAVTGRRGNYITYHRVTDDR